MNDELEMRIADVKMPKRTRKTRSTRFGEILKDAHKQSGLTNKEFAALLNLPFQTIWRYEKGYVLPRVDRADEILTKLKLTMTIGKV